MAPETPYGGEGKGGPRLGGLGKMGVEAGPKGLSPLDPVSPCSTWGYLDSLAFIGNRLRPAGDVGVGVSGWALEVTARESQHI